MLELNRWSPRDGYGLTKNLKDANDFESHGSLPEILLRPSDVLVLKLHGSVGWRSGGRNELSFDKLFLGSLLPASLEASIVDCDARLFDDSLPHALAYPSFLKKLENRFLLDIWHQADEAFRKADAVEIWGYSLPPSDSAARVLLLSLSARAQAGEVRVVVSNPNGEHLDRFHQFFGESASRRKRKLC